jgi:TMEM164 family
MKHLRVLHFRVGSWPYPHILARLKRLSKDKHSGLLRKFVTYGRKKVYNIAHWWTGGIDFAIPGYGGVDCFDHVTVERRIFETTLGTSLSLVSLIVGARLLKTKEKIGESVGR